MSQPTNKRYKLNLQDLLSIPEDRFDDFLVDLKTWHKAVRDFIGLIDATGKAKGMSTEDMLKATKLVWIDDGKHDGKIIVSRENDAAKKS